MNGQIHFAASLYYIVHIIAGKRENRNPEPHISAGFGNTIPEVKQDAAAYAQTRTHVSGDTDG